MAFTYDLSNADSTIVLISKIRLKISDTLQLRGPRVNGNNYSDEEITVFYESEGSQIDRTVAGIYEALAAEWGKKAGFRRTGPESEESRQADFYSEEAARMRARHGYVSTDETAGQQASFSISVTRRGKS